jgi:hypothetical protein
MKLPRRWHDARTPTCRGAVVPAFFVSEGSANPSRLYWTLALGALLLAVLGSVSPCLAQSAPPLTLDDILTKLQNNLDSYGRSIPSFLADEHIDSTEHVFISRGGSEHPTVAIAESVFRLKRDVDPSGQKVVLDESREIKTIDGKPANGRDLDAPTTFSGAFSSGLALVSQAEQACMRYALESPQPRKPIVVNFVSVPAERRPKGCILAEDGSGRVTIDPTSMQIAKIEIKVPHHIITPRYSDGHTGPSMVTLWKVQVDYKPVVLDARTFWLPATISSDTSADQVAWSFVATYRNYHLLQVRSRILLPTDAVKQ